jgi:hypothetical protein
MASQQLHCVTWHSATGPHRLHQRCNQQGGSAARAGHHSRFNPDAEKGNCSNSNRRNACKRTQHGCCPHRAACALSLGARVGDTDTASALRRIDAQVSIFAQHRSPCTLCITAENIVQVGCDGQGGAGRLLVHIVPETACAVAAASQVWPAAAPTIQPAATAAQLLAHPPTRAAPATSGASNARVEPLAATDAADDIFAHLGPLSQTRDAADDIFAALLSQRAGGARPAPQAPAPTGAARGPCGSSATQPSEQDARRRGDDDTAERAAAVSAVEEDDDGDEDDENVPTFDLLACGGGGGAVRDGKRARPDAPRAGEHDENVPPNGSSHLPVKQHQQVQPGRQHQHLSQHQSQQQPGGSRLKDLLLGQQDDIDLEDM